MNGRWAALWPLTWPQTVGVGRGPLSWAADLAVDPVGWAASVFGGWTCLEWTVEGCCGPVLGSGEAASRYVRGGRYGWLPLLSEGLGANHVRRGRATHAPDGNPTESSSCPSCARQPPTPPTGKEGSKYGRRRRRLCSGRLVENRINSKPARARLRAYGHTGTRRLPRPQALAKPTPRLRHAHKHGALRYDNI